MNNLVKKCCICNNKKQGEFIIINNEKYHLCCIERLKDNWNKLKEYAKENLYFYSGYQGEDLETDVAIQGILDKMQEIEQESDE